MKNYYLIFSLLLFFSCAQNVNLVEVSDSLGKFKVKIPNNWDIEKDASENQSVITIKDPVKKDKFKMSVKWSEQEVFDNIQALNDFIKTSNSLQEELKKMSKDFGTEMNYSNEKCFTKDKLNICQFDVSGVDIEGNDFIATTFHITKKDDLNSIVYDIRISQNAFDKSDEVLIESIVNSIVW